MLVDPATASYWAFGAPVPPPVQRFFARRKQQIGGLELLGVHTAISTWAPWLAGRKVIFWVDNRGAEAQLRRGAARRGWDHNLLVGYFWQRVAGLHADVTLERVCSKSNISDGPSRDRWESIGAECVEDLPMWPEEISERAPMGHLEGVVWGDP